jgi:protein subunit release factor B
VRELHLRRKDFKLEWFSGTGAGGQYRNKHQNCCRITHIETGLMATGQSQRDRPGNQKEAFTALAEKILKHYGFRESIPRRIDGEVVRNYHAERNEVLDKASGLRRPYTQVVDGADIGEMMEARKLAMDMPDEQSTGDGERE